MKEAVHRILKNSWFRQIFILLIVAAAGSILLSRLPFILAVIWENLN